MTSPVLYPIPSELCRLLTLRRVRRGHVVLGPHDLVVDHGRRVSGYIRTTLRELLDDGHLHLGAERAGWGQRPVLATPSGERLHTELEERRR
ncbi:MAG: hypothetical protein LC799_21810 [Actinobacteria bacterium]|nr:hypothetical protein [Actinomycetota bacterium]